MTITLSLFIILLPFLMLKAKKKYAESGDKGYLIVLIIFFISWLISGYRLYTIL